MSQEQPDEVPKRRPRFFNSLTAWIGGATAVIVALGGLASAYRDLFPAGQSAAQAPNDTQNINRDDSAVQPADAPASYSTDDGDKLKFVEGMWLWTTKEGVDYRYKELSDDGVTTVAVLKAGGEKGEDVYLRWPNAGGKALQSFDDQSTWSDAGNLTLQR